MQELSLNILDIAQNSVVAGASLIEIELELSCTGMMSIKIKDNGKGMDKETLAAVENPFFTSRTTRKVGLGIPLFKQAAEQTGGYFTITSEVGAGTQVQAVFDTASIDFTPLGEVWDTVAILIQMNEAIDFVYTVRSDDGEFVCDTRQLKEVMEGMPLSDLAVVQWIKEFIRENQLEILKRSY